MKQILINQPVSKLTRFLSVLVAGFVLIHFPGVVAGEKAEPFAEISISPLKNLGLSDDTKSVRVGLDFSELRLLAKPGASGIKPVVRVDFPINTGEILPLKLESFSVITERTRFVVADASGERTLPTPQVTLLRGAIEGQPGSKAFLALSQGRSNGVVTLANGQQYFLTTEGANAGSEGLITSANDIPQGDLPEGIELCGLDESAPAQLSTISEAQNITNRGVKTSYIAIDADSLFVEIFAGDESAVTAYIVGLFGAVSSIYERDVDMRVKIDRVRLWSSGGEPYQSDDVGSLRNWWTGNEDLTGLNYVHLLSGRRDLPFGGIAFFSSACSASAYAISGYLNGAFATPLENRSLNNWDVTVVSHEMGHNSGSGHTHDSFTPPIDSCGLGVPPTGGGTILSYCHIHTGYMTNIDLRFHNLVQQVIQDEIALGGCVFFDCNDNGIDDLIDITVNFTSADVNGNGIPDECEDCNNNGVLDPIDIATSFSADVNDNEIPDECETDCNGNGIPDEHEIAVLGVADVNGNNVPDVCEPDCDASGVADFIEIADGTLSDLDRDNIPDICQDCNGNSVTDWIDLQRQHNLFVADIIGGVREYHARSGWPVIVEDIGGVLMAYDVALGPDRQLYLANSGASGAKIYRMDPLVGTIAALVPSGGPLTTPAGIAFDSAGFMYVTDRDNNAVRKYDRLSGAFISDFVPSGSGGLNLPYGLVFDNAGDLLVTSSGNNRALKYDGASGAFIGDFISAGDGGLFGPRDLVFVPAIGDYVVSSYDGNELLQFDGSTGAFVKVFSDLVNISKPWGLTIGSNGNVFVSRSSGTPRILEYVPEGRYHRYYVRNEADMVAPTGLVFLPQSQFDIDADGVLDACTGVGCCLIPGDANNDSSTNIADVTFLITRIFGAGPAPNCADQADANGDNSVNIGDVTFLIARIFSDGAAPICGTTGI
jgi:Metallo-peptidase family M12/Dockerin type I domain